MVPGFIARGLVVLWMSASSAAAIPGSVYVHTIPQFNGTCVHNRVNVEWSVNDWNEGSGPVWIAVRSLLQNSTVAKFDVFQYDRAERSDHLGVSSSLYLVAPVPEALKMFHSVIYSRFGGPSIVPFIRMVSSMTKIGAWASDPPRFVAGGKGLLCS